MTRWKLEFMRWAEREQLHAWYMPKKPQDWAVAQQASRMADQIARKWTEYGDVHNTFGVDVEWRDVPMYFLPYEAAK